MKFSDILKLGDFAWIISINLFRPEKAEKEKEESSETEKTRSHLSQDRLVLAYR